MLLLGSSDSVAMWTKGLIYLFIQTVCNEACFILGARERAASDFVGCILMNT